MVAEMEAVVTPEDNDGIAGEAGFLECVENPSDLSVDEANGSMVTMNQLALGGGRQGTFLRYSVVLPQLAPICGGEIRSAFRQRRERVRLEVIALMEIPFTKSHF